MYADRHTYTETSVPSNKQLIMFVWRKITNCSVL